MRYSFDVEGRRAQMLVDNRAVVYGYDHAGRLEVVDDDAVALGPMQYVWDAESGRMKEILLPGGAKISMAHDSVGRLTGREYVGRFGQTLASVGYTHDKAGQRVTESGNRGSLSFDYDEKRQLIRAEGLTGDGGSPQEYNYSFDPIGNWLTGDIGEAGADEPIAKQFTANAVNQYSEIEVAGAALALEYDLNGNMTSDGGRLTMDWDQENRLTEVRTATTRSVFVYDGLGKRVERREYATTGMADPGTLTETVRYVYDGLLPVEERIWNGPATGVPAKVRKLTRGLDLSGTLEGAGGIGGLLAFTSSGQSSFYFSDANGNVTHLFDAGDQLKAEYKYDPFGNRLSASGPMAEESAWQWSGKEFHEPSRLVYYMFRFYNPVTGRWVSQDPLQEEGDENLYSHARNNATTYSDAFGQSTIEGILLNNFGHDWSRPLLGPFGLPTPIAGARFQIHGYLSGNYFKCCRNGKRMTWVSLTFGVEAYLVWGKSFQQTPKWEGKGRDRNARGMDGIKNKHRGGVDIPQDSGFRARTWHVDSNSPLPECPKDGWDVTSSGTVFVRGSLGVGVVGGQFNLQKTIGLHVDITQGWSFAASVSGGVIGATIEAGGGGSVVGSYGPIQK